MAKIDAGTGSVGALNQREHASRLHRHKPSECLRRSAANTNALLREVRRSVDLISESADQTLASYRTTADNRGHRDVHVRGVPQDVRRNPRTDRTGAQRPGNALGRLINDDSMYVAATDLVTTADSLSWHRALAHFEQVTEASHSITHSAEQIRVTLDQVTRNIMEGEGTVGKLVNDDSVYVKLNRTMTNLEIASQKLGGEYGGRPDELAVPRIFRGSGILGNNLEMKVEVSEQREYRLRHWEERLQQLQMRLEAQEQRLDAPRNGN